ERVQEDSEIQTATIACSVALESRILILLPVSSLIISLFRITRTNSRDTRWHIAYHSPILLQGQSTDSDGSLQTTALPTAAEQAVPFWLHRSSISSMRNPRLSLASSNAKRPI